MIADEVVFIEDTGRGVYRFAVADTEVHFLILAPESVAVVRGRIVRIQEDAVLDLPPLGVDGQAALRHLFECKRIGLSAGFVAIPSLENVTGRSASRNIVVTFVFIVRLQVGSVGNVSNLMQRPLASLAHDTLAVAVVIRAVHVGDTTQAASVEEINILT